MQYWNAAPANFHFVAQEHRVHRVGVWFKVGDVEIGEGVVYKAVKLSVRTVHELINQPGDEIWCEGDHKRLRRNKPTVNLIILLKTTQYFQFHFWLETTNRGLVWTLTWYYRNIRGNLKNLHSLWLPLCSILSEGCTIYLEKWMIYYYFFFLNKVTL